MAALHYLNAVLWLINAVLWFGYAHVPMMGVSSILAAVLSVAMARYLQD